MLFDDENYSKGTAEPPCSLYIILSQYMSPLATRLWVLYPERKDRKAVYLTMKPFRVSFEFCCEHPFSLELSWFFPTCAISCLGSNSSIYVDLIDGRTSASDQMTPHPHHRSGPAVECEPPYLKHRSRPATSRKGKPLKFWEAQESRKNSNVTGGASLQSISPTKPILSFFPILKHTCTRTDTWHSGLGKKKFKDLLHWAAK